MIKAEDGGYISSDEDETEGRKKNIDDLQRVVDLTIEVTYESQTRWAQIPVLPAPLSTAMNRICPLKTTCQHLRHDIPASYQGSREAPNAKCHDLEWLKRRIGVQGLGH